MNGLQIKIIEKALDADGELTEWEAQFISNLAEKSEAYELSEKQNSILNRILEKLS